MCFLWPAAKGGAYFFFFFFLLFSLFYGLLKMYQTDLIYQYSGRSIEKLFCFLTKLHNTQPDFYPVSWVCSS